MSICIIGNLNIDLIIRNVPKLPAWGQEVMGASRDQFSSGQAGYLAFALRRLGVATSLIGNVGDDLYGHQILSDLRTRGVNIDGVSVMPGAKTGISVAIVRSDGERAFVTDLGCLADFSPTLIEPHWDRVESAAIVCLVGLFCIPGLSFTAAAGLLGRARQAGKITMLDTGWDPGNWASETQAGMRTLLSQVSLFMPNQDEAQAISGQETLDGMAVALQALGPETVVIKCGENGSYARRGAATCHVPPRAVHVHDAVGAGDVFDAGFLFGLQRGWSLEACLAFGNTTASLYISRRQDRFPGLVEVAQTGREYPALSALDDITRFVEGHHD